VSSRDSKEVEGVSAPKWKTERSGDPWGVLVCLGLKLKGFSDLKAVSRGEFVEGSLDGRSGRRFFFKSRRLAERL
jgi:hypothetical protein